MALRNPPPSVPVRTYPAPNPNEQVIVEWVNIEAGDYKALVPGQPHPNQREFAGYRLGRQDVNPLDHQFVKRIWVTDQVNPDVYNYSIEYVAESKDHPIFIRHYRERSFEPRDRLSTLDVVYKLELVNPGSGYVPNTFPALIFSGGGGTGAAGYAVVNLDGSIFDLVLTECGENYTDAPTFTLDAAPTGTTATGTAFIQPSTAILVQEKAQEYPQESEFNAEYRNVVRVYQTLPGPLLHGQEIDTEYYIAFPYTLQETEAGVGLEDQRNEITPIDSVRQRIKTADVDNFRLLIDTYTLSFPGTANLQLPEVLTGLVASTSTSSGDGDYTEIAAAVGSGTTYFFSISPQGTSQGSASVKPGLGVEYKQYWARNIPTLNYFFFLVSPVTAEQVLERLTELIGEPITPMPKFVLEGHTVQLFGEKKSIELRARRSFQASRTSDGSSDSGTVGDGQSVEANSSVTTMRIPPMIHDVITPDLSFWTGSVGLNASINLFGGLVDRSVSDTVFASIIGGDLAATSVTGIPVTGKSLYRSDVRPYKYGFAICSAEVFDWSDVS